MQLEQGQQGRERQREREDLIANEFNFGEQQNLQFVLIRLAKLGRMQCAREPDFPFASLYIYTKVLHTT